MSSVIFSNAQRIIKQMFDFLQTSNQTKTSKFITDSFQTGIVPLELGEFSVVPGSNNTSLTPTVTVGSGVAYGPDSSRIIVSSGDVTPYNSGNPSNTTNDGLGNFLLTPQSTGVVNIPLTQSSQNYLWIQYLATIDTSAYTLNKETNAKQFYKQTDGYQITVTTTNTTPGPNYLFLANVNMTGGGAVTSSVIFTTNRVFFQINENVVPITTAHNDRSDATTSYPQATVLKLEDHIKAIGTGTGQSPTNPHNMSLSDLGVSQFDTVTAHRQLEHGNAIIAGTVLTPYPSTSAMATSINIVNPGSDTINVFQLLSSEFAIVNGTAYNVNAIFGSVPTNATIMFPDASGTYAVYWDSLTKVFAVTTGDISTDVTKLWLCTVTYTFVGHGVSDHNSLSSLIERRRIGSTVEKYQRWKTTARPPSPLTGEFGYNVSTNSPEYFDGTVWQSTGVPTGTQLEFMAASIPAGYLPCDGSAVSRTTYANLFAAVGTTWGVGDGSTTFNVPDSRRRVSVGSGGTGTATLGNTVGNTGGEENHLLVTAEIPSSLTVTDPGHNHTLAGGQTVRLQLITAGGSNGGGSTGLTTQTATDSNTTGISVGGGGLAHNNIQPSMVVTKIIKT